MRRLKAGVIGLGIGEQHVLGYLKADSVDVAALCDIDETKRASARQKYQQCKIYTSAEELIADPEIDVVSVASYDQDHAKQVIMAIQAGKHVFAEKPLCLNEIELEEIRQALAQNPSLRLSTNTILRQSPRFKDLKNRIENGEMGRTYYIDAAYNYGRLIKMKTGWRGQLQDYSVMLGGGIHMVDLILWLGGGQVEEVVAYGNKICSESYNFSTPDMVVALLKFKNGMLAKVGANFGCVFPHFHKLEVYGTNATFENRRDSATFHRSSDPNAPPEQLDTSYPGVEKGNLIPNFIDSIRGLADPIITEDQLFDTLEVCLAIDRSLREGNPVQLNGKKRYA
jgi:predicted dehydrogenase